MADVFITRADIEAASGIDILRDWVSGARPGPPICKTMNYRFVRVDDGEVELRGAPTEAHTNPYGVAHGGWFGTLLDTATACAVMSRLPRGRSYTTLEYKVNTLRPVHPGTEVVVIGRCRHAGRSTGVAVGEMADADGRLLATATQTVLMMEV